MRKARRPELVVALALAACGGGCNRDKARPAAATTATAETAPATTTTAAAPTPRMSWEQALAGCAPATSYKACVANLKAAGVAVHESGDSASFEVQGPVDTISVETSAPDANDRIVAVVMNAERGLGAPRKELVDFFKGHVDAKLSKVTRSEDANAAQHCGAGGWGVGWRSAAVESPEVQVQLAQPGEDWSDEDDWKARLEKLKPEDAVEKHGESGGVVLCFLWPRTGTGFQPTPPAPTLSPAALRAFVESPLFHGHAKLK